MTYQFTSQCPSQKAIVPVLRRFQEILIQMTTTMGDNPPTVFFPIEDLMRHIIMEVVFSNDLPPVVLRVTVNDDGTGIGRLEETDDRYGWIKIVTWKCLV